ncbi:glycosyltransferase [Candidatus Omnitrophota bacterium]
MKTITVLYIIDVLEEVGGAENNLLQVVTGLNQDKYRPIVCCLKGGRLSKLIKNKGIKLIDLKLKRIYGLKAIKEAIKLVKLIKEEDVRIVMTYFYGSDFWGGLIARITGVPVAISNRRDMGHLLKKRHVLAYRFFNRFFDKIITVSDAVRNMIIRQQKVSPEKLVTIRNGVDIQIFIQDFDSNSIKESLGVDSGKLIVTKVAGLSPIKGIRYFLEAASELLKDNKDIHFLVVGGSRDNGYSQKMRELVAQLGITKNITFTGARNDIPEILSISDVLVLSSLNEGFSNTILEYMASGKPVVATSVGGNPEVIDNGRNGFLVPPGDSASLKQAISKLLTDKDLSRTMSNAGRETIENDFTKQRMINQIEALYSDALSRSKGISTEARI